jgi:hypothetical protein
MRPLLFLLAALLIAIPAQAQTTGDDTEIEGTICAGIPDGTLLLMTAGVCTVLGIGLALGCAPVARPRDPGTEDGAQANARARRGVGLAMEETALPPRPPSLDALLDR